MEFVFTIGRRTIAQYFQVSSFIPYIISDYKINNIRKCYNQGLSTETPCVKTTYSSTGAENSVFFTSSLVQIIFLFRSFEISKGIQSVQNTHV